MTYAGEYFPCHVYCGRLRWLAAPEICMNVIDIYWVGKDNFSNWYVCMQHQIVLYSSSSMWSYSICFINKLIHLRFISNVMANIIMVDGIIASFETNILEMTSFITTRSIWHDTIEVEDVIQYTQKFLSVVIINYVSITINSDAIINYCQRLEMRIMKE